MGVLGSLLPGLREVRAPLAAGFIWIFALWLALEPVLPTEEEAKGVTAAIYSALGSSPLGVAAVASFSAYLIGNVSESVVSSAARIPIRILDALTRWPYGPPGKPRRGRMWRPQDLEYWLRRRKVLLLLSRRVHLRLQPYSVRGESRLQRIAADWMHAIRQTLTPLLDTYVRADTSRGPAITEKLILFAKPPEDIDPEEYVLELINTFPGAVVVAQAAAEIESGDGATKEELSGVLVGRRELADLLEATLSSRTAPRRLQFSMTLSVESARDSLTLALRDRIVSDFPLLRTRLLAAETQELFTAIDRNEAEAAFRFAIVPPLAALLGVMAARQSPLWLLGAIVLYALLAQGISRRQAAGDMLLDALGARVQSPALERLGRETTFPRQTDTSEPTKGTEGPTVRDDGLAADRSNAPPGLSVPRPAVADPGSARPLTEQTSPGSGDSPTISDTSGTPGQAEVSHAPANDQ